MIIIRLAEISELSSEGLEKYPLTMTCISPFLSKSKLKIKENRPLCILPSLRRKTLNILF